jgi:hypothetical protein
MNPSLEKRYFLLQREFGYSGILNQDEQDKKFHCTDLVNANLNIFGQVSSQ